MRVRHYGALRLQEIMPRNIQNISLHLINDRLVVGGVATIIRMIRQYTLAQGAACTLWVDEIDASLEYETVSLALGLKSWRKWVTLLCAPFPLKLMSAILRDRRQGKYPVLHLNTPYLSTALATVAASLLTRTPLVYTVHANKSHISSFYWMLENCIFARSAHVVLELSASLFDYRGKNQEKIAFVPFGVSRANTARKWMTRADSPFIFVAVNRMDPNRMVDVFIKSFAAQMAGNTSELHLVGDGADKSILTALAAQLGCGNRVKFFPTVVEIAIQDLLVGCDCFLTLTANGEVGMAGKLAAGVGIPCLAYEFDQPAATDYSAVSVEQLAKKMAKIAQASDSELDFHANMTTKAFHSSSEDMVDAYMRIYTEVAK